MLNFVIKNVTLFLSSLPIRFLR